MIFIGIDNGVSGAVACLDGDTTIVDNTPVFETFSYQKQASKIHRIDVKKLYGLLLKMVHNRPRECGAPEEQVHVTIERPMVMPARFAATVSALRAYEATLVCLDLFLPTASVQTVDSRGWQKMFLPEGLKGPELKKASLQRGIERWPGHADWIRKQKDADALFLALYGKKEHS